MRARSANDAYLKPCCRVRHEDVLGFQLSPDGRWAEFFADSELGEDVFELFAVPVDVGAFVISPDGDQVLFLADRAFNDRIELWRAPLHGGSPPVRVNGALIEAGDVSSFCSARTVRAPSISRTARLMWSSDCPSHATSVGNHVVGS